MKRALREVFEVDAQIEKVDRMLRAGAAKQRALDALTERLTQLEQQASREQQIFNHFYLLLKLN